MTTKISHQGIRTSEALITPDSPEWNEWMSQSKSFRFELNYENWIDGRVPKIETLSFSGIKVGGYWQAHKKVDGILRREHLGKNPNYDRLKEVAILICSSAYWHQKKRSPKKVPTESHKSEKHETATEGSSPTGEEISELRAEVERLKGRETYLLDQLGLVKAQIIHESQTEVESLKKQLAQMDKYNMELERNYNVLNETWRKSEQQRFELSARIAELENNPSAESLVEEYETSYETIKPTLAKAPKDVTRNWVEFYRFKSWLSGRLGR